jgi:hypothetical protein
VSGHLPLDPVGHGEPVVGAGDLIQPIEQDEAPAAAQLALPPAAGFLARLAADGRAGDIRQRDRWVGDDRQLNLPPNGLAGANPEYLSVQRGQREKPAGGSLWLPPAGRTEVMSLWT